MIANGLANISMEAQAMLEQIRTLRDEEIRRLAEKFRTVDLAKKSFAYLACIFVALVYVGLFANDLAKLYGHAMRAWVHQYSRNERTLLSVDQLNKVFKSANRAEYAAELKQRLDRTYARLLREQHTKTHIACPI